MFGNATPVYTCMYAILENNFNPYCLNAGGSPFKYRARAAPEPLVRVSDSSLEKASGHVQNINMIKYLN